MGPLEVALLCAALLVGATGTWSPCGFSMVDTIGPTGHTGGRKVTLAACATFMPGALAGAIVTFGGLALLGSVLPGSDWLRYGIAAAIALAAAGAEARGARLAPQIRRQLPEHWRRVMPMPLAASLYGVLLGLGFTTFVLTFGVWALAGIALALGEPGAGLAIGLGFGIGRALPIVALAPFADKPAGQRAIGLMAERPGLYRGIRIGDAAALVAVAGALIFTAGAQAEVKAVKPAADPDATGRYLVTQGKGRVGELRTETGEVTRLPGTDPAIGGPYVAVIDRDQVVLLARGSLEEVARVTVPGVDAVDVDRNWLVTRSRVDRRDTLRVRAIRANGQIGKAKRVATAGAPAQVGRPSLNGNRIAFALAKPKVNKIIVYYPAKKRRKTVTRSVKFGLSSPALLGKRMVYVRAKRKRDELRIGKVSGGGNRKLLSRKKTLWSTALTPRRAYVTVITGRKGAARVTSVRR